MTTTVTRSTKSDFFWFLTTFLALTGLGTVELFEQITYVSNWLIGDPIANAEAFRQFHHAVDAGAFHFPVSTLVLIGFIMLVVKSSGFMKQPSKKKIIWSAFVAFLITYGISVYIITAINVPVFNENSVPDEYIHGKLQLWGVLNVFRFILPAYAIYRMSGLLQLRTIATTN